MPAPPSVPAALFRHAASGAEEPWLFRAEGWDWRWHSWSEIAGRVRKEAERLSDRPAGSRVSFPYAPRPEEIVLDLAIQAAGLVAVPLSGPPPEPSPPRPSSPAPSLPTTPGEEGKRQELGLEAPSLPVWWGGRGRERGGWGSEGWVGEGEGAGEERRGPEGLGGAVVLRGGEAVELSAAELIAMAGQIQELMGRSAEREIVVLGGSLEVPEERAMLSWATVTGAAVVLEPNPALRAATAAWVRPTVFHGAPEEIAALRRWVEREKPGSLRRNPRLPFRRLRSLLVTGNPLPAEEEAFWRRHGVRVCRIAA